jgi:RNA polymerase sigma factor (sigma-70 family)
VQAAVERVGEGGGPSTFVDLYTTAYLPMVRLGHLLTGSNEVGEEVAQEAFSAAYRRFGTLDNPGGYVRRSVVNGCRSWHRRQAIERRVLARSAPVAAAVDRAPSELLDALATLPFRQRAALVLRFYEDRTMDDIAAALGCRTGTAKSLVSRGLARLREVVER